MRRGSGREVLKTLIAPSKTPDRQNGTDVPMVFVTNYPYRNRRFALTVVALLYSGQTQIGDLVHIFIYAYRILVEVRRCCVGDGVKFHAENKNKN